MIQVLCIGYCCYDLIFYPDIPFECNVKYMIRETDESGGGPAANAAYLLSLWGIPAAFAGVLGNDHFGDLVLREFEAVNTDVRLVEKPEGFKTPFSSIVADPGTGDRTIFTRHMTSDSYLPDWNRIPGLSPKVILADGHQLKATLDAVKRFPDAVLVLDAGSLRDETEKLLSLADHAVCSERFGCSISGLDSLDSREEMKKALDKISSICRGRCAVTLGEAGAAYIEDDELRHIPAFMVDAADTTAAGDIFHGAYVSALLDGKPFHDCLVFASAAAALSVKARGGRNSIPKPDDVKRFLKCK